MKIGIIGGGASAIYCALLIKKRHPQYTVEIFEKEKKVAKKLNATGNGHCNLLNRSISGSAFNNPKYIDKLLSKYDYEYLKSTIESFGQVLKEEGELIYPQSYNAPAYNDFLQMQMKRNGVVVHLDSFVADFCPIDDKLKIIFKDNSSILFDKIVFACGGKSQANLGSDGKLTGIFKKRGVEFNEYRPGLTPLQIKEKDITKKLDGYRHHSVVSIINNEGKLVYKEEGEVLFRDYGLSGIVIFNISTVLSRLNLINPTISLDLFPEYSKEELEKNLIKSRDLLGDQYLLSLFPSNVVDLVKSMNLKKPYEVADLLKNFKFSAPKALGFDKSQVSLGGIKLSVLNDDLSWKKDNRVFFIGEMVDIDGLCGGFNLSWALISALVVADNI
ncbi:MAG: aminoacetone oxidase family FAD-binding enzyme [Bacilli bacterium]|nr:aminoacetone oxidase family FAD-binding enzyme [Bacilli bacterium]